MAVKNAAQLLDRFCADGIAVEVTHRFKRRLFGLAALAPLHDGVAPPRRPEPARGRGRPPILPADAEIKGPPSPLAPLTPIERRSFDYGGLEAAMVFADEAIRSTRLALAPAGTRIEHIGHGQRPSCRWRTARCERRGGRSGGVTARTVGSGAG